MNIILAASSVLLVLAVAQKRVGAVRDLAASVGLGSSSTVGTAVRGSSLNIWLKNPCARCYYRQGIASALRWVSEAIDGFALQLVRASTLPLLSRTSTSTLLLVHTVFNTSIHVSIFTPIFCPTSFLLMMLSSRFFYLKIYPNVHSRVLASKSLPLSERCSLLCYCDMHPYVPSLAGGCLWHQELHLIFGTLSLEAAVVIRRILQAELTKNPEVSEILIGKRREVDSGVVSAADARRHDARKLSGSSKKGPISTADQGFRD